MPIPRSCRQGAPSIPAVDIPTASAALQRSRPCAPWTTGGRSRAISPRASPCVASSRPPRPWKHNRAGVHDPGTPNREGRCVVQQFRTALLLGPLVAVTPLSIDLYLPAFAMIAQDLGASEAEVQRTLIAYLLALVGAPFFYGQLSDHIGRKLPLLIGFAIYAAASAACATAQSIDALVVFRFLQGLGGAAAMVCVQASVRDRYSGYEAARMLSTLMLVMGLAPILAPIAGAAIIVNAPWQSLFWVLAGMGTASFLLVAFCFKETLAHGNRLTGGARNSARTLLSVLSDRRFLSPTMAGSLAQAGFFVYLTTAPFVIMGHFGQSPEMFALIFAANAIGLVAGSQLNVALLPRFGELRIARAALAVYAVAAAGLLVLAVFRVDSLWLFIPLLCSCVASMGFISPNTRAMAIDSQPHRAGSAAALMMMSQMGLGVVAAAIVSVWATMPVLSMSAAMAACSLMALAIAHRAFTFCTAQQGVNVRNRRSNVYLSQARRRHIDDLAVRLDGDAGELGR
ncbi:MAG: Bcr/CflA family efflux MFS transporter [Hyphomicrobiales bacterium]|nr:MAG: Bcr/CflA family efflux MFS transporter [Hyphomicrobiales bacterium]